MLAVVNAGLAAVAGTQSMGKLGALGNATLHHVRGL